MILNANTTRLTDQGPVLGNTSIITKCFFVGDMMTHFGNILVDTCLTRWYDSTQGEKKKDGGEESIHTVPIESWTNETHNEWSKQGRGCECRIKDKWWFAVNRTTRKRHELQQRRYVGEKVTRTCEFGYEELGRKGLVWYTFVVDEEIEIMSRRYSFVVCRWKDLGPDGGIEMLLQLPGDGRSVICTRPMLCDWKLGMLQWIGFLTRFVVPIDRRESFLLRWEELVWSPSVCWSVAPSIVYFDLYRLGP